MASGAAKTAGERTILLVEDNPNDEELTLRALEKAEIADSVAVCRDGAEALSYLLGEGRAEEGRMPAVVILDLKLPKVDGLEVLRRLRADERTALLPVVVLTSSDEQTDLLESYRLGSNSYVRKPVEFGGFMEAVQKLGLYWLRLNAAPPATG
jgi:two-component system response regulator